MVVTDDARQLASAVADARGAFRISLDSTRAGQLVLEVSRLGYAAARRAVAVDPRSRISLQIELEPRPIEVDELTVSTDPGPSRLRVVGFHERRRSGLGRFLGAAEIRERRALRTSDLFLSVPGIAVAPLGVAGGSEVVVTRSRGRISGGRCRPKVYLDGIVVAGPGQPPLDLDALLSPDGLAGVEVYRGPAEVPARFGGSDADCGVIVLWTW